MSRLLTLSLCILSFFFIAVNLRAQCNVSMQVIPPYSVYLDDYIRQANHLVMTVNFAGTQQRQVKFQIVLTGNNGVEIRTNNAYPPPTPFTLSPGQTYTLTGAQLGNLINVDHLEFKGISQSEMLRTGQLPEGIYQFCAQVFDYQTSQPMSQPAPQGCSSPFQIQAYDPPTIINPTNGSHITYQEPQYLMFSWLPPTGITMSPQYKLRLTEIPVASQSAAGAFHAASIPLFERTVYSTTYLLQASDPKLNPGKRYAFAVTAIDPTGQTIFRNKGESEVYDIYCDILADEGGKNAGAGGLATTPRITSRRIDSFPIPVIDTIPNDKLKACSMMITEYAAPALNGCLAKTSLGKKTIQRDELISLKAIGLDYDMVEWVCTPSKECDAGVSRRSKVLTGRVRFDWKIDNNEGNFTKLGFLPEGLKKDSGGVVMFQPPYVEVPKEGTLSKTTTIKLTISDDNFTQILDDSVVRTITITTTRSSKDPDHYVVEIAAETVDLPTPQTPKSNGGPCPAGGGWTGKSKLPAPKVTILNIPDKDKILDGEWILLEASELRDIDELPMSCEGGVCGPTITKVKFYEDNVDWKWSVMTDKGGKIIASSGRYAIYEASVAFDQPTEWKEVKIEVYAYNPEELQTSDTKSEVTEVIFPVYRPGVMLHHPGLTWLPVAVDSVRIESELMYYLNAKWNPAPDHARRIHFMQLLETSHLPGISSNFPAVPKATPCADLSLSNNDYQEAFTMDKMRGCTDTLFLEARSKLPQRLHKATVLVHDYAAYGSMLSLANLNHHKSVEKQRLEQPHYYPIPWDTLDGRIAHPNDIPKKFYYPNTNQITIPRDVDENHIADGGWHAQGGKTADSGLVFSDDFDHKPKGNGVTGDGLVTIEEYRGFILSDKSHTRTNPMVKDIFIYNPDKFSLDVFRKASSLGVHDVALEQLFSLDNPVINFMHVPKIENNYNQKGLKLSNEYPGHGYMGRTYIKKNVEGIGNPNQISHIYVSKLNIDSFFQLRSAMKGQLMEKTNQIVAHELAHGCNVSHHGSVDKPAINGKGGGRSGNTSCIMRYDNWDSTIVETIGTLYCTSKDGTGNNAGGKGYGTAKEGNCDAQFHITGRTKDQQEAIENKKRATGR